MRYYKQFSEDGILLAIGTGFGGIEITKEEYDALLAEIVEKADLVNRLYNEEITIDSVPADWREEIQRRVDERKALEEARDTVEISDAELADMMEAIL